MKEYYEIQRLTKGSNRAVVHKNGDTFDNRNSNLCIVAANHPLAIQEREMDCVVTEVILLDGRIDLVTMHDLIAYHNGMLN